MGRSTETKNKIELSLLILMKKEKFENIAVTDITRRAKVSRMTFYRYYKDKEAIFKVFADERFEEFDKILADKLPNNPRDFCKLLLDFIDRYRVQFQVLIKGNQYQIMDEQYKKYVQFLSRFSSNLSNKDKYSLSFISGGISQVVFDWMSDDNPPPSEKIVDDLVNFLNTTSL